MLAEGLRRTAAHIVEAVKQTRTKYIAQAVFRIAVGVLLVFLVQILVGVWRYSSRMAAFYQGRADALLISSVRPKVPLKEIVDWFAGDKIPMEKPAKSPTERVLEARRSGCK